MPQRIAAYEDRGPGPTITSTATTFAPTIAVSPDAGAPCVESTRRRVAALGDAEIGTELVRSVVLIMGATTGALYLAQPADPRYRLRGCVGTTVFPPHLEPLIPVSRRLREAEAPVDLLAEGLGADLPAHLAVPLRSHAALLGFVLLGPRVTGVGYTGRDRTFLATVAEVVAGSIATARLTEAVAQARALEAFGRVTSAVIHDIKNSVSALSLLIGNAASNFDDPEFRRDTIATLARTVDRMRRLLGRLSSPGTETAPLRREAVDLGMVVAEASMALAVGGTVRLVRDLGPVGQVYGDREALLRVVENLVTNAVEAIAGEGTVTLRLTEDHGWAVLQVSDTGCGIPEEFLRRFLFSPFRSTKKGGWGVGLYQAKQVVERHGGEIGVESAEGRGTTFRVRLPLRERTR